MKQKINEDLFIDICEHHRILLLTKFEIYQNKCADPFQKHKKPVKKAIRNVSRDLSKRLFCFDILIAPGQKLCKPCKKDVEKSLQASKKTEPEQLENSDSDELDASYSKNEALKSLNSSLSELGKSPLRMHGKPLNSRKSYAKRKVKDAYNTLKSKVLKVIDEDIFTESASSEKASIKEIKQKAEDFDKLLCMLKEKVKLAKNRREIIQLLTLIPSSWSRKKIKDEFKVSDYAVRQSRQLLQDKGILAIIDTRKGKPLSNATVELIRNFYESDDNSRIMPGKKDVVSIAKNVHAQKRLILCNLRELYSSFKQEFPEVNVKFSKFCSLRPKWCVLAGSSGTHSICVCMKHQNTILLLHAAYISENYQELIKKLVCSTESKDCMLRHCANCPNSDNIQEFLEKKFEDFDATDEIQYEQWVNTDRTEMMTFTVTLDEFITTLIKSLDKLIPHSFITKSQSTYFKEIKANLTEHESIVLLDFSENFKFVIQDEVQNYHWTKEACTVHPGVIYTRSSSSNLSVDNLCILSDDMQHDVAFVYVTQKEVTSYILENHPTVKKIYYFSDGCPGQYKNCKNFLNLCHHKEDFSLEASWSFFATSHGKSPCDGIGGTVKRLIARESLQRCYTNQINSVQKAFKFCNDQIHNISFRLLLKDYVQNERKKLESRFSEAKTIPGTQGYHHFVPVSRTSIGAKRISYDEQFSSVYNFNAELRMSVVSIAQLTIQGYVACIYDGHWFFGMVQNFNKEENDATISFMHPYGPAKSFYWPNREDVCEVPLNNIICTVNIPSTKGCGRMWYFDEHDIKLVQKNFEKLNSKAKYF